MFSEYKMQVIRQVLDDLNDNYETNQCTLTSSYFNKMMGFEVDSVLTFMNIHTAKQFVINEILKSLE